MPEQFHLIITEHCTCAMDSRPSACRAPGTPFAWTALPLARSTPRRTAHCTSAWGTLPAPRASKRTTPQLQTTGLATHAITHATLTAAPGAMRSTAHLPVSSPTGDPTEGPSMRSNARHHARHHTRSNTARAAARNRLSTAAPADPARHLHSRCHRCSRCSRIDLAQRVIEGGKKHRAHLLKVGLLKRERQPNVDRRLDHRLGMLDVCRNRRVLPVTEVARVVL